MSSPSASATAEVSAVSVSPTWAAPLMARAPVAGLLATCCWTAKLTESVAALVRDSEYPPLSVKDTRTLTVLPSSAVTRV